ncbi:MAG: DnaB-like helicase N-terminal domain-containing protein [Paludibacteraceae bacterium]
MASATTNKSTARKRPQQPTIIKVGANEMGKLPPQALDLEEAVLGALMIEKEAYGTVADLLRPEVFYSDQHRLIFEAIRALAAKEEPIDMMTVAEKLRQQGTFEEVGGASTLSELTRLVASTAHLCFEKLKVNTASGGADISGVSAKAFELNTASGDISINAFFEDVKLQSASGNITLTNPTENAACSVRTCAVSGSTTVNGYKADSFSVHSVSGNTTLNGISGSGEIAVTSGKIDLNYAEWNADLKVSAISGNVNVNLPENSGMELKFDGMSGALKTDIGCEKGKFMNIGKGTSGEFGGENKHKITVSLTSGNVVVAQAEA